MEAINRAEQDALRQPLIQQPQGVPQHHQGELPGGVSQSADSATGRSVVDICERVYFHDKRIQAASRLDGCSEVETSLLICVRT